MEINIKMLEGTSLKLTVNPDLTVGSLKTLIQNQLGVPPQTQRLIFVNGQKTALSDDSRSVGAYGLFSGCQLSLLLTQRETIEVHLRNGTGKISTYDVKPDETVADFRRRVQSREKVQDDQFRLVHEGKDMLGGKLADYNVREGSIISMTLRLRGG